MTPQAGSGHAIQTESSLENQNEAASGSPSWSLAIKHLGSRSPIARTETADTQQVSTASVSVRARESQKESQRWMDSEESDEQLLPPSRVYQGARVHPSDAAAALRKIRAATCKDAASDGESSEDDVKSRINVHKMGKFGTMIQCVSPIALAKAARQHHNSNLADFQPLPEAAIRRASMQDASDDEDQAQKKRHTRARRVKAPLTHRARARKYLAGT